MDAICEMGKPLKCFPPTYTVHHQKFKKIQVRTQCFLPLVTALQSIKKI